jgi:hypothetical protein
MVYRASIAMLAHRLQPRSMRALTASLVTPAVTFPPPLTRCTNTHMPCFSYAQSEQSMHPWQASCWPLDSYFSSSSKEWCVSIVLRVVGSYLRASPVVNRNVSSAARITSQRYQKRNVPIWSTKVFNSLTYGWHQLSHSLSPSQLIATSALLGPLASSKTWRAQHGSIVCC